TPSRSLETPDNAATPRAISSGASARRQAARRAIFSLREDVVAMASERATSSRRSTGLLAELEVQHAAEGGVDRVAVAHQLERQLDRVEALARAERVDRARRAGIPVERLERPRPVVHGHHMEL